MESDESEGLPDGDSAPEELDCGAAASPPCDDEASWDPAGPFAGGLAACPSVRPDEAAAAIRALPDGGVASIACELRADPPTVYQGRVRGGDAGVGVVADAVAARAAADPGAAEPCAAAGARQPPLRLALRLAGARAHHLAILAERLSAAAATGPARLLLWLDLAEGGCLEWDAAGRRPDWALLLGCRGAVQVCGVDLSGSSCADVADSADLVRRLAGHESLRSLSLRHLGDELAEEQGDAAQEEFAGALPLLGALPRLRHLDVTHCELSRSREHAAALARAVSQAPQLRSLRAAWNGLGPAAAQLVGDAPPLQSLHVGLNAIGPAGAEQLAAALRRARHLTELEVNDNALGPEGCASLCRAAAEHPALLRLGLHGNGAGARGAAAAAEMLRAPSSRLRSVDLSMNSVPADALPELCAAACEARLQELSLATNDFAEAEPSPLLRLARHPRAPAKIDLFEAVSAEVRAAVAVLLAQREDCPAADEVLDPAYPAPLVLRPEEGHPPEVWPSALLFVLASHLPSSSPARVELRRCADPAAAASLAKRSAEAAAAERRGRVDGAVASSQMLRWTQDARFRDALLAVPPEMIARVGAAAVAQHGDEWGGLAEVLGRLRQRSPAAAAPAAQPSAPDLRITSKEEAGGAPRRAAEAVKLRASAGGGSVVLQGEGAHGVLAAAAVAAAPPRGATMAALSTQLHGGVVVLRVQLRVG
eukprot:TRINITY_DN8812_c0_g1_i2.p1 TRINITY_DN8812_c0_g1~~TRINITY_DN8812_c0_g1_i2.p1  ORF type:complete len:727 (+),score=179.99 TRINITY_DN8812_c0_g1_i2:57-2183(+)